MRSRKTTSAIGERQMLPVQTKQTRKSAADESEGGRKLIASLCPSFRSPTAPRGPPQSAEVAPVRGARRRRGTMKSDGRRRDARGGGPAAGGGAGARRRALRTAPAARADRHRRLAGAGS